MELVGGVGAVQRVQRVEASLSRGAAPTEILLYLWTDKVVCSLGGRYVSLVYNIDSKMMRNFFDTQTTTTTTNTDQQ